MPFAKYPMGLPIIFSLFANPAHAQVQRQVEPRQTTPPHSMSRIATASKAQLAVRFRQIRNQYVAIKDQTAKYAPLRPVHPMAVKQTRSEINSNMAAYEKLEGEVKQNLDSMGELGEQESLRLQMSMDRMSKLMATISNIMKKLSETGETIVQNIK